VNNDATTATLGADLFDPATGSWSSTQPGGAGFAKFARLYHSVALLLPDATVATTGSNPQRGWSDRHIEIYSPAYLFNANGSLATRPVITGAPSRIGYNSAPFTVQTPDAPNIRSVVLIKPGSGTHAYDMEQRLIGLTFTAVSGALTVNAPPNSNLAPPSYYMLFALNQTGVPSVARFVQVSQNPTDQPPKGTITAPAGDVTINAGQAVKFAGAASDADGSVQKYSWFFPEGTPESSTAPSPGTIVFPNAGTYVASLTAVDDKGVNDPSPPTRTITVQP
jgi:galactose oxidase-like protein/PKD domain-containing protein